LRSGGAPQICAASSTRETFGYPFQTFHVWLPSFRRFTANRNF
jgi:hypothetical protein